MRRVLALWCLLVFARGARAELCVDDLEVMRLPLPDGKHLEVWGRVGVFTADTPESQRYGFRLLEAAFAQELAATKRILILGAGGGFEAIALAERSPARIDALELDPAAVELARVNVRRHGLGSRVRVARSDLFTAARGRYDLVLFNAPRPIEQDWVVKALGAREGHRVWREKIVVNPDRFDPNGRLIRRCLRQTARYLRRDGRFLLMSEEHIDRYLPRTLRTEVWSVDPWCEDAREGRFAIHVLTHAREK